MKLLLDECLPVDLRLLVVGHDVFTVAYQGWKGIKNGKLLALAGTNGFDAVVTTDAGIEHEQNATVLPVAVVILRSRSNDIEDLVPLVPELLRVLSELPRNAIVRVG